MRFTTRTAAKAIAEREKVFCNPSQKIAELIDIFISRLTSLQDPESIQQLCQAEIALLSEGYPPASVAKNYLPKYRKAIADIILLLVGQVAKISFLEILLCSPPRC